MLRSYLTVYAQVTQRLVKASGPPSKVCILKKVRVDLSDLGFPVVAHSCRGVRRNACPSLLRNCGRCLPVAI